MNRYSSPSGPRPPLTERQDQVLQYVRAHLRRSGRPPSIAEIGGALAIRSTNGVHRLVTALVEKGYLRRAPLQARGITLADGESDGSAPRVPFAAAVSSANPPSLRLHAPRDLVVDPSLLAGASAADCVVLTVGDSGMEAEGVLRGDLLLVERRPADALQVGRLVAVLYRDSVAARRLEAPAPRLVVSTAGPSPEADLIIPPDPTRLVAGHVLAVIRPLS